MKSPLGCQKYSEHIRNPEKYSQFFISQEYYNFPAGGRKILILPPFEYVVILGDHKGGFAERFPLIYM